MSQETHLVTLDQSNPLRTNYYWPAISTPQETAVFGETWDVHEQMWRASLDELLETKIEDYAAYLQGILPYLKDVEKSLFRDIEKLRILFSDILLKKIACDNLVPFLLRKFEDKWENKRKIPKGYCLPVRNVLVSSNYPGNIGADKLMVENQLDSLPGSPQVLHDGLFPVYQRLLDCRHKYNVFEAVCKHYPAPPMPK